jgi:hypothetical protein
MTHLFTKISQIVGKLEMQFIESVKILHVLKKLKDLRRVCFQAYYYIMIQ